MAHVIRPGELPQRERVPSESHMDLRSQPLRRDEEEARISWGCRLSGDRLFLNGRPQRKGVAPPSNRTAWRPPDRCRPAGKSPRSRWCSAALVGGFLGESLFGGKVLSPADVLFVSASFRDVKGAGLRAGEPAPDGPGPPVPALAGIQPGDAPAGPAAALERPGRLRRAPPGQRPERGLRPVPPDRLPRHAPRRSRLDGRRAALGRRAGDVPAGAVVGARAAGGAGSRG